MRPRTANALLLLASLLAVVLLVEGGYRAYLMYDLEQARAKLYKPEEKPTFGFYGWPPPWKFDAQRGFSFNDGPWLSGRVERGRFDECRPTGPGNRFGNFGPERGRYEDATLKIALFGSSYTLVDHSRKGDTSSNLLQQALTARLGRPVHVMNYSRDATGLFTMFDIADDVLRTERPDLMLFTFNMTALGYRRHWRVVREVKPGFFRMYFSRDASEEVLPGRAMVHVNPITPRVTAQWCAEMADAKARGDAARISSDPLLVELTAEYKAIMRERSVPRIAIDFAALDTSFVYNMLAKGDPFGGRPKLADNSAFWASLSVKDYFEDTGFAAAVSRVAAAGIPYEIVHLPALPELRRDVEFLGGSSGLTDEEQVRAMARVEQLAGRKLVRLLDYYQPGRLAQPLQLVASEADSHPSAEGVIAMAEALERMLDQRGLLPPRSPAGGK